MTRMTEIMFSDRNLDNIMACDKMDLGGEPTITTLLNRQPANYTLNIVFTHLSAVLTPQQGTFTLQPMKTISENCQPKGTVVDPSLNCYVYSTIPHPRLRDHR